MAANTSCHDNKRHISLTLTAEYAPNWGTWEGVRELIQNWHDGIYDSVSQKNVSMVTGYKILFRQDGGIHRFKACLVETGSTEETVLGQIIYDLFESRLTLVNSCTELKKKILLLGYSGKSARKEIIGQFGEGLKVGALALLRNGHQVTMETCEEEWKFDLLHNDEFDEKVLTVVVTDRELCDEPFIKDDDDDTVNQSLILTSTDTCTTITGVDLDDWKTFLPRFLFLQPPVDSVKTHIGTLLLDESLSGQLYVKGLWVSDLRQEDLSAGVNFTSLQLDRDRNAVPRPSEIDHMISGIWIKAVERRPDLLMRYFDLLKSDHYRDVRHAVEYSTEHITQKIADVFLKKFGDIAFPMLNSCTAQEMASVREELQKTAVLCNQSLFEILMKSGSYRLLENALEDNRARQRKPVAFFSLTKREISVIESAVELAKKVDTTVDISLIDVMETDLKENCSNNDKRMCVPRWYMNRELVHKRGRLCQMTSDANETDLPCWCCEVVLCDNILALKKYDIYHPLMYLVHRFVVKKNQNEGELNIQPEIKDGDTENRTELFIARETKLLEKIEDLETRLETERQSAQETLVDVTKKLSEAEKEITRREVLLVDEEEHIRESFRKEIEQWKKNRERRTHELEALVFERDDAIINLQTSLEFKDRQLAAAKKQMESVTATTDKKMGCLADELTHYIAQNRTRTKSLSRLCAEQYQQASSEDPDSKEKWQLLQNLCDTILEELQQEKVLCSVCKLKRKDSIIWPCSHYCLCGQCALTLMSTKHQCPLCRTDMESYMKVYES